MGSRSLLHGNYNTTEACLEGQTAPVFDHGAHFPPLLSNLQTLQKVPVAPSRYHLTRHALRPLPRFFLLLSKNHESYPFIPHALVTLRELNSWLKGGIDPKSTRKKSLDAHALDPVRQAGRHTSLAFLFLASSTTTLSLAALNHALQRP